MNKKIRHLTKAAVIAAVYTVLTLLSGAFGLAYGNVQFRISEAMCILPLFTSAAIPGLTVGCLISNIFSTVNPVDMILGSLASCLAAVCTRKCRFLTVRGFPFLSLLFPVLFNAVFIGAEIAFFSGADAFIPVFTANAMSVGAGEAAVIYTLGTALFFFIRKNDRMGSFLSD